MLNNLDAADFINLVLTVLALYGAWINFSKKRISKWGLDAFFFNFLGRLIDEKQTEKIHNNPKLIRRSGFMMVLFAIGGLWAILTP